MRSFAFQDKNRNQKNKKLLKKNVFLIFVSRTKMKKQITTCFSNFQFCAQMEKQHFTHFWNYQLSNALLLPLSLGLSMSPCSICCSSLKYTSVQKSRDPLQSLIMSHCHDLFLLYMTNCKSSFGEAGWCTLAVLRFTHAAPCLLTVNWTWTVGTLVASKLTSRPRKVFLYAHYQNFSCTAQGQHIEKLMVTGLSQ